MEWSRRAASEDTLTIEEWKAEQQLFGDEQFLSIHHGRRSQGRRIRVFCEQAKQQQYLAWIATHTHMHMPAACKRGGYIQHWMASLILAQDERWRRA
jgi:hypothetical protein